MTPARTLAGWLIRGYQLMVSPFMAPCCRFEPSCSAYAYEAIQTHGIWLGSWLMVKRLLRCHPWGGFGYDPVPGTCEHAASDHNLGPTAKNRVEILLKSGKTGPASWRAN